MRYGLAIFDFDGTLADSFPWFVGAVDRLADRHGFRRLDPAEHDALRRLEAPQVMARLGVRPWRLPAIARDLRAAMAADVERIRLFDGIGDMLARADAAGVRLAIVSSNAEANVRRILGPTHAGRIAAFACGASLFGKGARLRRVVRALGVPPTRVLCVGDEPRDLRAARGEALACGGVAWGYTAPAALEAEGPDEWFASPQALADFLAGPG
jgi:phosphoglycolate phosphatase